MVDGIYGGCKVENKYYKMPKKQCDKRSGTKLYAPKWLIAGLGIDTTKPNIEITNVTWKQVKEKMTRELFNLINNYMTLKGKNDGESLDGEKIIRFAKVVERYAKRKGKKPGEALKIFLSATKFNERATSTVDKIFVNKTYLSLNTEIPRGSDLNQHRQSKINDVIREIGKWVTSGVDPIKVWKYYVEKCEAYEALTGDPEVLQMLFESFKEKGLVNNALIIARAMKNSKHFQKNMLELAVKCLESRDQKDRELALVVLGEVNKDYDFAKGTETAQLHDKLLRDGIIGHGDKTTAHLITAFERVVKVHADVYWIEKEFVQKGDERAEVVKRFSLSNLDPGKLAKSLKDLDKIIRDTTNKYDNYSKAYAYYLRGIILFCLAQYGKPSDTILKNNGASISAKQLFAEAMYNLGQAFGLASGNNLDPKLFRLKELSYYAMGTICDTAKHFAGTDFSSEIAAYIPENYDTKLKYTPHFRSNGTQRQAQPDGKSPSEFRTSFGAGGNKSSSSITSYDKIEIAYVPKKEVVATQGSLTENQKKVGELMKSAKALKNGGSILGEISALNKPALEKKEKDTLKSLETRLAVIEKTEKIKNKE